MTINNSIEDCSAFSIYLSISSWPFPAAIQLCVCVCVCALNRDARYNFFSIFFLDAALYGIGRL